MARTPVPETGLLETDGGLMPEGDGWFVVNVADALSLGSDESQYGFVFEGAPRRRLSESFPHFSVNIRVLSPDRLASMYHAEAGQEAFLVLQGECLLVVEEQERRLRQWDFVHLPPNTAHVLVGAGDAPCIVLMVGARNAGPDLIYPASRIAAKHGASTEEDTTDRKKAYAGWPAPQLRHYPWPLA